MRLPARRLWTPRRQSRSAPIETVFARKRRSDAGVANFGIRKVTPNMRKTYGGKSSALIHSSTRPIPRELRW